MKLKLDAGDYAYLEGKTAYVWELPDETTEISVELHASEYFELGLETGHVDPEKAKKWPESKMLWLCTETRCSYEIRTTGFCAVHVKTKKTAKLAARVSVKSRGEKLDPTPISVTMSTSKPIDLKTEIRKQLAMMLSEYGSGVDPDEFDLSPLDGDFDDDEFDVVGPYDEIDDPEPPVSPDDVPDDEPEDQPEEVTGDDTPDGA